MELPGKIRTFTDKKPCIRENIGLSGASVHIYGDMVLKIQPINAEARREYAMLSWLSGKLPVPKIIEHANTNKLSYLLMSRCEGKMACSDQYMQDPKHLAELLAEALYQFWSLDQKECPYNNVLEDKLKQAEFNVTQNLVNTNDFDPNIYNEFKDPETLLKWLQNNKPNKEELVVTHGDFCLPNILFNNDTITGIIDLGRSGVADKWNDIAICYRSLRDNYNGKYSQAWQGFYDDLLFDALQIKPDWEKVRYYILLDELF